MSDSNNSTTSILILDDHPMLRKGVESVIQMIDSDIEVIQASTLKSCIELIELYSPTLIISDLNLPDAKGIDSVKTIVKATSAPVLVYSLKQEELSAPSCYKNGAKAYVMKDASPKNLEDAILALLDGKTWCTPTLATKIMQGGQMNGTSGIENLSKRELEIFESIGDGITIKEIAYTLNLSPKTVESHRDRIKTKLSLSNSNELTLIAREWLNG